MKTPMKGENPGVPCKACEAKTSDRPMVQREARAVLTCRRPRWEEGTTRKKCAKRGMSGKESDLTPCYACVGRTGDLDFDIQGSETLPEHGRGGQVVSARRRSGKRKEKTHACERDRYTPAKDHPTPMSSLRAASRMAPSSGRGPLLFPVVRRRRRVDRRRRSEGASGVSVGAGLELEGQASAFVRVEGGETVGKEEKERYGRGKPSPSSCGRSKRQHSVDGSEDEFVQRSGVLMARGKGGLMREEREEGRRSGATRVGRGGVR